MIINIIKYICSNNTIREHVYYLQQYMKNVKNIEYIYRGKYESRILQIEDENKKITTPTYFPSISSAATRLHLLPLIQLCVEKNYPRLLVSAYDLHQTKNDKKTILAALERYVKTNFLFIDSGTFESYWLNDPKWKYSKYANMIHRISGDFYTSFDEIPNPHDDLKIIFTKVSDYFKKSEKLSNTSHCSIVAHGNSPAQLIQVVEGLAKNNQSLSMISVPERDCGKTLQDKINTIQKLRKILSENSPTNMLHILGCGNPLSIAMFSYAGADSFDSVDWSRWSIDPKTLQFMDLNHLELINCTCDICKRKKLDPTSRALLHNLLFYQEFTHKIQMSIIQNQGLDFLRQFIDRKSFSKIVKFF